ncbi:unnamed protein product [Rotaria socialis]|nr:unnamed protein product [Rotaria socialis]
MGNAIIGNNPTFVPLEGTNVFQGYIDKLTVSRRPKSAYEILEEATLAARFPFDNTTILVDFGPNAVSANASSYSILTNGHSLQAIGFNGSMSYFQTWGFTQFSINNQPFSISLQMVHSLLKSRMEQQYYLLLLRILFLCRHHPGLI